MAFLCDDPIICTLIGIDSELQTYREVMRTFCLHILTIPLLPDGDFNLSSDISSQIGLCPRLDTDIE